MRVIDGRRAAELTYKQSLPSRGADTVRRELTVEVDAATARELLTGIGLRPLVRYVKRTRLFRYRGTLVSLDRVRCPDHRRDLGWFCEIEALTARADLDGVADRLGLRDLVAETYPTLVRRACGRA